MIDRFYFRSIYFREPSGVLFEIATLGPGFTVDEPLEHLGEKLSLPPDFEHLRAEVEPNLRPVVNPRSRVTGDFSGATPAAPSSSAGRRGGRRRRCSPARASTPSSCSRTARAWPGARARRAPRRPSRAAGRRRAAVPEAAAAMLDVGARRTGRLRRRSRRSTPPRRSPRSPAPRRRDPDDDVGGRDDRHPPPPRRRRGPGQRPGPPALVIADPEAMTSPPEPGCAPAR